MGIRLSKQGQRAAKQAQKERGWPQDDVRWQEAMSRQINPTWQPGDPYAYGVAQPTWIRFLQRRSVNANSFKVFCAVLNLDWEVVVDREGEIEVPELRLPEIDRAIPTAIVPASHSGTETDWGDAPDVASFYGRGEELAILQRWIKVDRCRLVMVLGIGGIGKTTFATHLAYQLEDQFDRVIWRSLLNAPSLNALLSDLIGFLSGAQDSQPDLMKLLDYLRRQRCLLVLDNAEAILQSGEQAGGYREGYEGYGILFRQIGNARHKSCLILTSREKPHNLADLEGMNLPVRALSLVGLDEANCREILRVMGLSGSLAAQDELIAHYAGNPQALKVIAASIRDLFDGDIGDFLRQGVTIFSNLRQLFDQQFDRLSDLEKQIMDWLAIHREPVTADDLSIDLLPSLSKPELLEGLESLVRRSLLEKIATQERKTTSYTQQPVIMEYVTEQLIERVVQELLTGKFDRWISHALIRATAKQYVRDSQIHLILEPIATKLQHHLQSGYRLEALLKKTIGQLQAMPISPGYGGGNLINLCRHLKISLTGYDLSGLPIWQAYLQDVTLHNVNFSQANFARSVFAQQLGGLPAITFSPNGELLATGDTNGEVILWQVSDGNQRLACREHTHAVHSLTFSLDGNLLVTGSEDGTIRLWDTQAGACRRTLTGHTTAVHAVALSSDGHWIASGGDDCCIKLWQTKTGTCVNDLTGHDDRIHSLAFSPDGQTLLSGDCETIRCWRLPEGNCQQVLSAQTSRTWSFAFDAKGQPLAVGNNEQTATLWDIATGRERRSFQGHTDWIWAVVLNRDGSRLASSSNDQTIRIWDTTDMKSAGGRCLKVLQEPNECLWSLAFSLDSQTLASGSDDQMVKLWEVSSGLCLRTVQGHTRRIWSFALSPDLQQLVTGSDDKAIRFWDVATGHCLSTLQGHTDWVCAMAFNPQGTMLASGSDDQTVKLWATKTGKCLKTLSAHTERVRSVAFNRDGSWLASASNDYKICLWDVATGDCIQVLEDYTSPILAIVFHPTAPTGQLASSSHDQTVQLWDVLTGDCLGQMEAPDDRIQALAFSPDGSMLAGGGYDNQVWLWEVATGRCLNTLTGHTGSIRSLAFSQDSTQLVSGSDDHTIRLWNLRTQTCLAVLQDHTNQVWLTQFDPQGQILASGSYDGTVKLWNLTTYDCWKTLTPGKPYAGMNLYGATGLTTAQKTTLKALGAIERLGYS